MKITLIFIIGKCPDTRRNAGRGSVGGFFQIFAAPASRPAGVFAINGGSKGIAVSGMSGYQ